MEKAVLISVLLFSLIGLTIILSLVSPKIEKDPFPADRQKHEYSQIIHPAGKPEIEKQRISIVVSEFSLLVLIPILFLSSRYFKNKARKKKIETDVARIESILPRRGSMSARRNISPESREAQMNIIARKIKTARSLRLIRQARHALSPEELQSIKDSVNICYDNFEKRLRMEFPKLMDEDIYLCCLLKIRVPYSSLLCMLDISHRNLRNRTHNIEHDKMKLPGSIESLDRFLLDY